MRVLEQWVLPLFEKPRVYPWIFINKWDPGVCLSWYKEYLKHCKEEIENYCSEKLYLQLNAKTQIGKLSNGIDFLGFRTILNENGKIIRLLRAQVKQRLRRKIKHLYKFKAQRLVDDEYVNVRLNAYYAHLCHSDALKLMHKYLNRYKNDF